MPRGHHAVLVALIGAVLAPRPVVPTGARPAANATSSFLVLGNGAVYGYDLDTAAVDGRAAKWSLKSDLVWAVNWPNANSSAGHGLVGPSPPPPRSLQPSTPRAHYQCSLEVNTIVITVWEHNIP